MIGSPVSVLLLESFRAVEAAVESKASLLVRLNVFKVLDIKLVDLPCRGVECFCSVLLRTSDRRG